MSFTRSPNETLSILGNMNTTVQKLKMDIGELAGITAIYVILMAAILVGNGLILASFIINKRLRTITNRLVMGLAVSDILVGMVSIPCWVYIYVCQYKYIAFSEPAFQFYIMSDIFIGSASILQLTSISIERCHAIARPLRHRTLSKRIFYAMILIPWLYAGFVAILQPVQSRTWPEAYTILMTTTCFFIPLLIIIVTYSCILKFARSKLRRKLTQHKIHRSTYHQEIRLATTVAMITALFLIEWLPLFVVTVVATYYPTHLPSSLWTDRLLKFVKWMHYSNSAVDPFVYAYRNRDISLTFRYILRRVFCCGARPLDLRQARQASQRPFAMSTSGRNQRRRLTFEASSEFHKRNSKRCHRAIRKLNGDAVACSSI